MRLLDSCVTPSSRVKTTCNARTSAHYYRHGGRGRHRFAATQLRSFGQLHLSPFQGTLSSRPNPLLVIDAASRVTRVYSGAVQRRPVGHEHREPVKLLRY